MATRARKLSADHVEALNMIDVEFHGASPKEKAVALAWKEYLDHLNNQSFPKDAWAVKMNDLFVELVHKMALCLGYDFDKVHIKNQSYSPIAHGDIENDQLEMRKRMLELLRGNAALPVTTPGVPAASMSLPDARAAAPARTADEPRRELPSNTEDGA
jgi:O-glycosyl hydrolase